jgi:hypothetical protein
MGAAVLVIPLGAMVVPIVLILLAVVVDVGAVMWALYRLWHDEWSVRIWHAMTRVFHHRKHVVPTRV